MDHVVKVIHGPLALPPLLHERLSGERRRGHTLEFDAVAGCTVLLISGLAAPRLLIAEDSLNALLRRSGYREAKAETESGQDQNRLEQALPDRADRAACFHFILLFLVEGVGCSFRNPYNGAGSPGQRAQCT